MGNHSKVGLRGPQPEMRQSQQLTVHQWAEQTLTAEELIRWEHFRRRFNDPFPLASTAIRNGSIPLSQETYVQRLRRTSNWINHRVMSPCIARFASKQAQRDNGHSPWVRPIHEWREEGFCFHIGIGPPPPPGMDYPRGMDYLAAAYRVGLMPWLIDWNADALECGRLMMPAILGKHPDELDLEEIVQCAEASRFFNSSEWQQIASRAKIVQMSTVIEHQSEENAEKIILGVAQMLRTAGNQLVIIDTPQEDNEQFGHTTSHRRPEREMLAFLLETLTRGAGTQVRWIDYDTYREPDEPQLVAWTFARAQGE